jgi:hypothetical protein
MTDRNPGPFFIQHLDLGHGPNGGNWTRYAETLEEAFAATDAVYDPKNPQLRQESSRRSTPPPANGDSAAEAPPNGHTRLVGVRRADLLRPGPEAAVAYGSTA